MFKLNISPSPSGKVSLATKGDNKSLLLLALRFLSPIGLTFISFRQPTPCLFCRFATFPPLQRRNLPPKEEAIVKLTRPSVKNLSRRRKQVRLDFQVKYLAFPFGEGGFYEPASKRRERSYPFTRSACNYRKIMR